jgi:2,4-dichlorophenol 6-monooxygenase
VADIQTDVLIIGTGPAGSSAAALLSTYGVENMAINRYRWLANTPRAHITNQRTMEVLRDLGREVEDEAYMFCSHQDLMGENVFCESLAGEEIGRMKSWGNHPLSKAEHQLSSPTMMNDLPQTFMEPLLFKTACSRGTQARMSTEYLRHEQDADGVTTTCLDRLTGKEITIRSKYLLGADGGNSKVAELEKLPFEGQMGVGGSMNIIFKADLSKFVAHRPSVLYWVVQPGADVGGIGMGLVRMVRPWNEWLIVWGYDINGPEPVVDNAFATKVVRDLVGDQSWSRRSPRYRPGPSTTCTPRTCSRAACSSWATQRTGIRHRTVLAPTPRSRTASTSPGSWPRCSRDRRAPPCSTPTARNARRSPSRSSPAPTSRSASSARSSRRLD